MFTLRTCIENKSETHFLAHNPALYLEIALWNLEWIQKVCEQVLGYEDYQMAYTVLEIRFSRSCRKYRFNSFIQTQ